MGPPKKRPKITSFDEVIRRYNCFEYRWNSESHSYYLFNPWTGETIFNTALELLDRSISMWAEPDKFPSKAARNVMLYPEFYASRRWGRRAFHGFQCEDAAATCIAAVTRGYLARQKLRRYYRFRYYLKLDSFSGYFFFVDSLNPNAPSSWHKPRLSFPGDILKLDKIVEDPEDYMKGKKYSRGDFTKGPILVVKGLNKCNKGKSTDLEAFYAHNEWRAHAIRDYKEIDLFNASKGSVIAWFDSYKATKLEMSSFNIIRAALETKGWSGVLQCMKNNTEDLVMQIYGFRSFAKTKVPLDDSNLLDFSAADAMEYCVMVIKDAKRIYPSILKIFALEAIYNIFCVRAGRLEYLDSSKVPEQGELRQAAVEKFIEAKFSIFLRYLTFIPNQTVAVYMKGASKAQEVKRPVPSSIDLIEVTVKCLGVLAQENETKEQLAFLAGHPLHFALDICQEESTIMLNSLQFMYNLCYRCEAGQEAILSAFDSYEFFATVHHNHSGDPDVMRQCRRLELSLKKFGWRGGVEELITKEMNNEKIDDEYNEISEYERRNLKK